MKQTKNMSGLTSLFSRAFKFIRHSGGPDFELICVFARKCENTIQFAEIRMILRRFLRIFHSVLRDHDESNAFCTENALRLQNRNDPPRSSPRFAWSIADSAHY